MINDFLLDGFKMAHINYKINEPLKNKNTFKIESSADVFVLPESIDQLLSAAGASLAAEEKFFVLGGGSNIVFPDNAYHHLIISTENLNNILMTDDIPESLPDGSYLVTCECGTTMAAFVNFCTAHELTGAEQFAGLPGTIGGAVYMNARCFDRAISDLIYETQHIEVLPKGRSRLVTKSFNKDEWDYKKSPFQTEIEDVQKIITSTTFLLKKDKSKTLIEADCKKYISERVDKGHFKYPSAGSVFKNNRNFGKPSGKIIDEAGLKGYAVGGAQIAPFHGNFIINANNAKASDIKALVIHTQKIVKEKFGFQLDPEIIFLEN